MEEKRFNNLRKAVRLEAEKYYFDSLERIRTEEGLKHSLSFNGKTYKGTEEQQKTKLTRFLKLKMDKRIEEQINKIKEVEEAQPFNNNLVITVEWKKSYMWGKNPKAYTNYGFESSSIGGCGYCKHSTATAEALNSHKPILKLLYAKKDREMEAYFKANPKSSHSDFNRSVLGYGSGYGVLPYFEGGVGVGSHRDICKGLHLNMRDVTSTNNVDVHIIE